MYKWWYWLDLRFLMIVQWYLVSKLSSANWTRMVYLSCCNQWSRLSESICRWNGHRHHIWRRQWYWRRSLLKYYLINLWIMSFHMVVQLACGCKLLVATWANQTYFSWSTNRLSTHRWIWKNTSTCLTIVWPADHRWVCIVWLLISTRMIVKWRKVFCKSVRYIKQLIYWLIY